MNIYEYIDKYGDYTFDEKEFNQVDKVIFSFLSYANLEKVFEDDLCLTIAEAGKQYLELHPGKDINIIAIKEGNKLLKYLRNKKRYMDCKLYNYEYIGNDEVQFGVVSIEYLPNQVFVSFEGTDSLFSGWREDFILGYQFPTISQKLAIKYLNKHFTFKNQSLIVGGHSKGGNLALVSGMEASEENFDKIIKVYNFDGPGLRYKEYTSDKYERLRSKLVNVMPSGSVIGTLLYNKDYIVVNSKNVSFGEHYPDSWGVYGEFFITNTLSKSSLKLHDSTTIGIKDLDEKEMKNAFETVFKNIELDYTSKFKLDLDDLQKTYRKMKDLDPKAKEYLDTMFSSMLKALNVKR